MPPPAPDPRERLRQLLLTGLDGPVPLLETRKLRTGEGEHLPAWTPPACHVIQSLVPDLEQVIFLSRGGMGAVYRCYDPKLNRDVALKFLPVELAHNEETLKRFRQEGKVMASLRHEHIVSVFSCIEEKDYHCLLMEFVEGQDLQKLIRQSLVARENGGEDPLPLADGLRIFCEVCEGVQHAHEQGLLHRDLKPANILVDLKGKAHVADFGLARVISREESQMSIAGRIMGSLNYMAPEQIRGQHLDERTDVFALGVMLQEIITGGPPGPKPSSVRKGAPRALDRIVARAMAQDSGDRWQTAAALGAAVRKVHRELLMPPWRRATGRIMLPLAAAGAVAAAVALLSPSGEKPQPVVELPVPVRPVDVMPVVPVLPDPPGTRVVAGMRMVPVPGMPHLLAGMHEVRVADFAEFLSKSGYVPAQEVPAERREFETDVRPLRWDAPGRPQEPDQPVTCITWDDADAFCQWLTDRCRADGTVPPGAEIRLLTDLEWSAMAGVPPDAEHWVWERTARPGIYPWGRSPERQPGWENHAGTDEADGPFPDRWEVTAPVGSMRRNAAGFQDTGGNVREWVMDAWDFARREHTARSSGFRAKSVDHFNLSRRSDCWLDGGNDTLGMRVALDLKDPDIAALAARAEAAILTFHGGTLPPPGRRARACVTANIFRLDLTRCGSGATGAFAGLPVTELLLGAGTTEMDLSGMRGTLRRLYSAGYAWPRLETAGDTPFEYVSISGEPLIRGEVRLDGLNVSALRGLAVTGVPGLTSLEPLRSASKLTRLVLVGTGVSSLEPVNALPLREVETLASPLDLEDLLALPRGAQVAGRYSQLGPFLEAIHRGDHGAGAAWLKMVLDQSHARSWGTTPEWVELRSAARRMGTSSALKAAAAWNAAGRTGTPPGQPLIPGEESTAAMLPGMWHSEHAWHLCAVTGALPVTTATKSKLSAMLTLNAADAFPMAAVHLGCVQTVPGVWSWCSGEPWTRSVWSSSEDPPWLFSQINGSMPRPLRDLPMQSLWHHTEIIDNLRAGVIAEWSVPAPDSPRAALQRSFSRQWTANDRTLTLHPDGRVNDLPVTQSWWCLAAPEARTALLWEVGGIARSLLVLAVPGDTLTWKDPGGEMVVMKSGTGG